MRSAVVYLIAVAAGLFVVVLLMAGGACGYAIAHATTHRAQLLGIAIGAAVLFGLTGTVIGSVGLSSIKTPAVATSSVHSTTTSSAPDSTYTSTPQPATDAWMHFQSDYGDYIGAGKQKVWTLKESDFSIRGTNHDIHASVSGQGDWWYLEFRGPSNGDLRVGQYINAERAPFVTGKAPGLDVNGDGRGCNTLAGDFNIRTLVWTSNGTVSQMDVLFEQHCEGMTPALRGELWITTKLGVHKAPPDVSAPVTF